MDTHVAQGLIPIIQMARLLGTKVMLVGIRPEVAQALIARGLRLDHVIMQRTLQSGFAYTLQRSSKAGR